MKPPPPLMKEVIGAELPLVLLKKNIFSTLHLSLLVKPPLPMCSYVCSYVRSDVSSSDEASFADALSANKV